MHGSMSKKKDQEEGGKLLNKLSSDEVTIDRGFELMIRNKNKREEAPSYRLRFDNVASFFNREWSLTFDFIIDIKKKP